jgi:Phosphotransferase enzyme family
MAEQTLPGGRTSGTVRVGDTVRRPVRPWTASVTGVLQHLAGAGFDAAPRTLGTDELGREVLTYLPGNTVGDQLPWPEWIRSDEALTDVGRWLRRLHDTTAGYVPAVDAVWFGGQNWAPDRIIGHHDAAPYNAVWDSNGLTGFIDWDTAGPSSRELDIAYTALTWIPLQPPHTVRPLGYTGGEDRHRRFHLLLDAYGYTGDRVAFQAVIPQRAGISSSAIRRLASAGDPVFTALLPNAGELDQAAADIAGLLPEFWSAPSAGMP